MDEQAQSNEWYREPWLWFVLSPLIVVFCVSSITVTLAVRGADDVVSDNYYKEGRMLAQETTSEEYAKKLGVQGKLNFDLVSGEVFVDINRRVEAQTLTLLVSHPAQAELDQTLDLKRINDHRFRADIGNALSGRWYLRLSAVGTAEDKKMDVWRLHGEIDFSTAQNTVLK